MHNLLSADNGQDIPYLFRSASTVVEFVVIEEGMAQLNEYCYMCAKAAVHKLSKLERTVDDIAQAAVKDPASVDEIQQLAMEDELLQWSHTEQVIVAGMSLILLAAFVEKNLKWLLERYAPPAGSKPRSFPGQPKITGYVEFLRQGCQLEFTTPPEAIAAMDLARRLRNEFAHGDWEQFEESLRGVELSRLFDAVTRLFQEIEAAYMRVHGK